VRVHFGHRLRNKIKVNDRRRQIINENILRYLNGTEEQ